MPSLKQIKNKISSVKGTRRIMSAMRLIAAVKLQKAQGILRSYRPYSDGLGEVILNVAKGANENDHPLLRYVDDPKNLHIVFFTSDRGLCGSFNSITIRNLDNYLSKEGQKYENITLSFIGRKGYDYFVKKGYEVGKYFSSVSERNSEETASELASYLAEEFVSEKVDEIVLVYNFFETTISQKVTYEALLPISTSSGSQATADYEYEPSKKDILDFLLSRYLKVRIERAIYESLTSEHASRMTAMENATRNADEVIEKLTLQFNKTRQAMITTELMDIVNGTEALKKGGDI